MDIEKEKSVFLGIYKYYPSAIKFTFDVENECFVLSKKNPLNHEVEAMSQMNQQWRAWLRRAKLEYEKLKGCVVVPVQCPDPDFADSLFDELSKKAIGEFGDDLLIHFSDIDEEKIWALMVEAAKAQAVPETQQSKQAEIDDLNAQLKAVHDSRIEFVEYCRKVESGDFVLVSKNQIEVWWQDSEEPENFATKEDDLSFIAQHIEDDEVMEINEHHTVHLPSVTKFGAWVYQNGQRKFFVGTKDEVEAARGGNE